MELVGEIKNGGNESSGRHMPLTTSFFFYVPWGEEVGELKNETALILTSLFFCYLFDVPLLSFSSFP